MGGRASNLLKKTGESDEVPVKVWKIIEGVSIDKLKDLFNKMLEEEIY